MNSREVEKQPLWLECCAWCFLSNSTFILKETLQGSGYEPLEALRGSDTEDRELPRGSRNREALGVGRVHGSGCFWCSEPKPGFSCRPHATAGRAGGQQGVHGAEWGAIRRLDGLSLAAPGHRILGDPRHDLVGTEGPLKQTVMERDSFFNKSVGRTFTFLEMFCKDFSNQLLRLWPFLHHHCLPLPISLRSLKTTGPLSKVLNVFEMGLPGRDVTPTWEMRVWGY